MTRVHTFERLRQVGRPLVALSPGHRGGEALPPPRGSRAPPPGYLRTENGLGSESERGLAPFVERIRRLSGGGGVADEQGFQIGEV